jgi:multidrug efflux pump
MYLLGIELQRISLGALIIALGLLVDDAIIAVEMMALKLEQGWDRARAATFAYTATAFPMLTGTLITAAGFLPIGFAKSNAGQYVFSLFQVVGISLVLSWIVAVVFTPYIGFHLLPELKGGHGHDEDAVYQRGFYAKFRKVVDWCLEHRGLVIGVTVAMFVASVGDLQGRVPQQFFPASERPEIMVQLWMPEAATTEATEAEVRAMEAKLKGDADIVAVTSYVGRGSPRFYLPLDVQSPNVALAEMMVMTTGKAARERVTAKIQKLSRRLPRRARPRAAAGERPFGRLPGAVPRLGSRLGEGERDLEQVATIMRGHPNLLRVNSDWAERTKTLRVEMDQDKARQLGITSRDVADALQGAITGFTVTQYREGDKAIDVVSRLPEEERTDLNNLRDTKIYLSKGKFVPVSQVARLSLASEQSVYWRRNRVPTITVRADVLRRRGPGRDQRSSQPKIAELQKALPIGYASWPAARRVERDLAGLDRGCVPGHDPGGAGAAHAAAAGHEEDGAGARDRPARHDRRGVDPRGLPHPVRLRGDARRDRALRHDHPQLGDPGGADRPGPRAGLPMWDAIVESTVRRFRPIVLTAAAAILAMIPLTRSTFWGPMAWAIMGGLLVATLLTLLFLPALYAACYRAKRPGAEPAARHPSSGAKPLPTSAQAPRRRAAMVGLATSAQAIDLVGAYERAKDRIHDPRRG